MSVVFSTQKVLHFYNHVTLLQIPEMLLSRMEEEDEKDGDKQKKKKKSGMMLKRSVCIYSMDVKLLSDWLYFSIRARRALSLLPGDS